MVRPLVVSSHQWRALRDWLGNPPELDDEELATYGGRLRHPDVLAKAYAELFADTETEAICEEAQRRNVPATPVMSPAELLASGPMAERGTFAETTVEGKSGRLAGGYWEFDDVRVGFREPARPVGADTAAVVAVARPRRGTVLWPPLERSPPVPRPARALSAGSGFSSSRS